MNKITFKLSRIYDKDVRCHFIMVTAEMNGELYTATINPIPIPDPRAFREIWEFAVGALKSELEPYKLCIPK